MRFDNYYVSEYKRVLDNIKVNEDKLVKLAENIEKNIETTKTEDTKKIVIASAAAVALGVGVGVALRRRK